MRPLLGVTILLALSGCDQPTPEEAAARVSAAVEPLCPLWPASQVAQNRLAAPCPWPAAPRDAAHPAPCAIEHYLDDSEAPRTTRRMQVDEQGRLTRYSDHTADGPLSARRLVYEERDGQTLVHHYRYRCEDPAPQFERTERILWNADGSPKSISMAGRDTSVSLAIEEHWRGARVFAVLKGNDGTQRLRLGPGGVITERTWDDASPLELAVSLDDGRVATEELPGAYPGRTVKADYRYDERGRLVELRLQAKQQRSQRFRFSYKCSEEPTCVPTARERSPASGDDWLAYDPSQEHFTPRSCTEQLRHSPRMCDKVGALNQHLTVECCHATPNAASLVVSSPFSRAGVEFLRIETRAGKTLESQTCAQHRSHTRRGWRCGLRRDALSELPDEVAELYVLGDTHQALEKMRIDLARLKQLTR